MAQRIAFVAHGRVQGVSYRAFAKKKATSYSLTGWVRNTSDGKVEGEAQGEDGLVQRFLKDLDDGPPMAHVFKLEKQDQHLVEGEMDFEIR